jgi:hypothetical protein
MASGHAPFPLLARLLVVARGHRWSPVSKDRIDGGEAKVGSPHAGERLILPPGRILDATARRPRRLRRWWGHREADDAVGRRSSSCHDGLHGSSGLEGRSGRLDTGAEIRRAVRM